MNILAGKMDLRKIGTVVAAGLILLLILLGQQVVAGGGGQASAHRAPARGVLYSEPWISSSTSQAQISISMMPPTRPSPPTGSLIRSILTMCNPSISSLPPMDWQVTPCPISPVIPLITGLIITTINTPAGPLFPLAPALPCPAIWW